MERSSGFKNVLKLINFWFRDKQSVDHTYYFGNFSTFTERLHSKGMRHIVHGDGVHLNDSIVLTGEEKRQEMAQCKVNMAAVRDRNMSCRWKFAILQFHTLVWICMIFSPYQPPRAEPCGALRAAGLHEPSSKTAASTRRPPPSWGFLKRLQKVCILEASWQQPSVVTPVDLQDSNPLKGRQSSLTDNVGE